LSTTLVDQIGAIVDEIAKAAEALALLDAHAKRVQNLQAKVFKAMNERSAVVARAFRKAEAGALQANVLADLRAAEESASSKLLKLQMQMQRENRVFTSVSNILKTRHDTAKSSIGNVR
jgi:hypothetical protein